jgi:hypothetical protein
MSLPRYIQNNISYLTTENVDSLILLIGKKTSKVMRNIYGNYFYQAIIPLTSIRQRHYILTEIASDFLLISTNDYGTYCIQKFIEYIDNSQKKAMLLRLIIDNAFDLSIVFI